MAVCGMGAINLVFIICLLLAESGPPDRVEGVVDEGHRLLIGQRVEREMGGGESHFYDLMLSSGEYARIVVAVRGIDLAVSIAAPDGTQVSEMDHADETEGPESVSAVADVAGCFGLLVRSAKTSSPSGTYQVWIDEIRPVRPEDGLRIEAEKAFATGERLRNQASVEQVRRSVGEYERARDLWRAIGDAGGEGDALNNMGAAFAILGDNSKALASFEEAVPLLHCAGFSVREGQALNNIGFVYNALGENRKALEYYSRALGMRRAVGDRGGEAVTLNNMGYVHDVLGEKQRAIDLYHESLPLKRAVGDRRGEGITLNNIGLLYKSMGEMQRAFDSFVKALDVWQSIGDQRHEALALNNLGSTYCGLGELQEAKNYFNRALPMFRSSGRRADEATTLNNLGLISSLAGNKEESLSFHEQSLRILREVGDRRKQAFTLHYIALLFDSWGNREKAIAYVEEGLSLIRGVGDRRGEAILLDTLGVIESGMNRVQDSVQHLQESLDLRRAVQDRQGEAETLFHLARVRAGLGNLAAARAQIEASIAIIEVIRTRVASQDLRASFLATAREKYELYIDLLMRLHKLEPLAGYDALSLNVCERARARSLVELLIESGADIREGVDRELLARERSLGQLVSGKLDRQVRVLSGKHTDDQAAAIAEEVRQATAEHERVKAQIRSTSPRYAALTQPDPLTLAEIQERVLDPDTLLLEYTVADRKSYLFAATATSLKSFELPGREEIEEAAKDFSRLVSDPDAREDAAEYREVATRLSQMLLGAVAADLGEKRLLVIPDGVLHYVPFAALPTPGRRQIPLVVEHEIAALPSASTLAALRRERAGRQPARKTLAVLADPVFSRDDERVRRNDPAAPAAPVKVMEGQPGLLRSARDAGLELQNLPRLPFTRREARAILGLVPQESRREALDFEASLQTLLAQDLRDYRFVHLATHGFLNSSHPELSGLILSMVDPEGREQRGFLPASEVFNLRLSADLVVLSACRSALGREIRGEGVVGLTRAFMYAGASAVVASLWKVDDAATAELMRDFYAAMLAENNGSPSAAMRIAQIRMWKEKRWRAPFYWAAFIVQGDSL
ncbi:MAG: CHAT domain-containing protein [Acidobacteriota bacterium]